MAIQVLLHAAMLTIWIRRHPKLLCLLWRLLLLLLLLVSPLLLWLRLLLLQHLQLLVREVGLWLCLRWLAAILHRDGNGHDRVTSCCGCTASGHGPPANYN